MCICYVCILCAAKKDGPTLSNKQPGVELPVTQGRPDMPETQPSSKYWNKILLLFPIAAHFSRIFLLESCTSKIQK